jgi:hypothetical protein
MLQIVGWVGGEGGGGGDVIPMSEALRAADNKQLNLEYYKNTASQNCETIISLDYSTK